MVRTTLKVVYETAAGTPTHEVKTSPIVRYTVHESVSLYGNTWKTQLPHIFKERDSFVYSYISLSPSWQFPLEEWGVGWGGDNQRSAFSSHSHQQRRDARHAQHKSDKVKVIIKKCFFALLLTDPTQQDSFCSVKPTVQQRRTYSIKTFLHNMKTSSVKPGRSIWTSA